MRFGTYLILAAILLTSGCDELDGRGAKPGTIAAVDQCIKKNKNALIRDEVTRTICINKNQIAMDRENVQGEVHFYQNLDIRKTGNYSDYGGVAIQLYNHKFEYVITSYILYINFRNVKDKSDNFLSATIKDQWIQPGEVEKTGVAANDLIGFADLMGSIKIAPKCEAFHNNEICWEWYISELYGIKIQ